MDSHTNIPLLFFIYTKSCIEAQEITMETKNKTKRKTLLLIEIATVKIAVKYHMILAFVRLHNCF